MRRMYSKPQLLEAVEQEAEVNGLKAFENIVDKDGHKRFIEGDGVPLELTGFTGAYCKWSLSGTHIMFVLAGTLDNTTAVSSNSALATFTLPKWIYDKIYVVWGVNALEMKNVAFYGNDWTSQSVALALIKSTDNKIIINGGGFTASADRNFRVAFDLLIDNE